MKKIIALAAVLAPSVASAAVLTDVNSVVSTATSIGNTVIGILIAFAVIYIIYNVIRFIMAEGDDRAAHRSNIGWGIVGLAIILSIWGLVAILTNSFRTDTRTPVEQFPVNPNPPSIH